MESSPWLLQPLSCGLRHVHHQQCGLMPAVSSAKHSGQSCSAKIGHWPIPSCPCNTLGCCMWSPHSGPISCLQLKLVPHNLLSHQQPGQPPSLLP